MAQDISVVIKPLNFGQIQVKIVGIAPYMQARFSQKAMNKIKATHEAGSQAKSKKVREARDFEADYEASKHRFEDGTCGIPAGAFRQACISACRTANFKMTLAKLSIFIEADGLDVVDGTPLIRIHGEPEMSILPVRNATGVMDLRSRAMWKKWHAILRIRFDMDQFSPTDIVNLLTRAGIQVGIGEGRPDSRESAGMGLGIFHVEEYAGEN